MNKKTRWSVVLVALVVLVLAGGSIIWCYGWFLGRYQRMLNGTASASWPFADRSISELNKLYPQNIENTAPTKQSPEQTHQLFVDALKRGDFDAAVNCCFREGDRARMKTMLEGVKSKGLIGQMVGDLSGAITENVKTDSRATYNYSITENGKNFINMISFLKTSDGIWYIESL